MAAADALRGVLKQYGTKNMMSPDKVGGGIKGLISPDKIGKQGGKLLTKGNAAMLLAFLLANKLAGTYGNIQQEQTNRAAIRSQENIMSPENLYYQAALPQAQQEEEAARMALLNQISGGVLGPSLARGERLI